MSLFKISDLQNSSSDLSAGKPASSIERELGLSFTPGKTVNQLSEIFGTLKPGHSKLYHTEGAWSNIELLEHILKSSGPAKVYFSTWSISVDAIRRFVAWQQTGLITDLFAVLDRGIRNRKPEIFQQCIANFKNINLVKCHAKITVIENEDYFITMLGSANYTENPRLEAGIIVFDKETATNYKELILSKISADGN